MNILIDIVIIAGIIAAIVFVVGPGGKMVVA